LLGEIPKLAGQTSGIVLIASAKAPLFLFCGNSTHLRLANCLHVLTSRIAGLVATVTLDANAMTMTPAPPAPFAIGATVRFLPDPNHVERVLECEWISLDAAAHWRLITTWTMTTESTPVLAMPLNLSRRAARRRRPKLIAADRTGDIILAKLPQP
jgi:hypothetical protein